MGTWPRTFDELVHCVRGQFGVELAVGDTGDDYDVLRGRLEGGDWLIVSDADGAFLAEIEQQLESDEGGHPSGWFVGIYTNDASGETDCPTRHAESGCIAYAQHDHARFHELNDVIVEAIDNLLAHRRERAGIALRCC